MQDQLEKKYGLLMAIAMVVGIVIGSGVFFKAEKVLVTTGGDLPLGILAWFLGGLVMIICAYNFAVMATKYEKARRNQAVPLPHSGGSAGLPRLRRLCHGLSRQRKSIGDETIGNADARTAELGFLSRSVG